MITYKVKLAGRNKRPETVVADYFRIENGAVTFRCVHVTPQGYPVFIKCYGPGTWLSIENVTPGLERLQTHANEAQERH